MVYMFTYINGGNVEIQVMEKRERILVIFINKYITIVLMPVVRKN